MRVNLKEAKDATEDLLSIGSSDFSSSRWSRKKYSTYSSICIAYWLPSQYYEFISRAFDRTLAFPALARPDPMLIFEDHPVNWVAREMDHANAWENLVDGRRNTGYCLGISCNRWMPPDRTNLFLPP